MDKYNVAHCKVNMKIPPCVSARARFWSFVHSKRITIYITIAIIAMAERVFEYKNL